VAHQRNIFFTSSFGQNIQRYLDVSGGRAETLCDQLGDPVARDSSPAISTGAVSGSRRVSRGGGRLADVSHRNHLQRHISRQRHPDEQLGAVAGDHPRQVLHEECRPEEVHRDEPMRNSSMRLLLSKCGMPVFRSAPPTEL